jgi:hypothetical protein
VLPRLLRQVAADEVLRPIVLNHLEQRPEEED